MRRLKNVYGFLPGSFISAVVIASWPPAKKIITGFNPLEVDRQSAKLLGLDWKIIRHLAQEI
jgi:hypothetical protein